METGEYIILIIVGSLIASSVILPPLIQIKQDIAEFSLKVYRPTSAFIINLISNPIAQIVLITLILELLIYLLYKNVSKLIQEKRDVAYEREENKSQIEEILNTDFNKLDYDELLSLFDECDNLPAGFPEYRERIDIALKKIKNQLTKLKHTEELNQIRREKQEARQELERINHEIYLKELRDKEKISKVKERLEIGIKKVFKKENLSANEREIVKQEGYKAVNEYCVLENKIIPVLVKPPLNHSPTHAFLSWSVKRLLKKFPKIERIMEHETRDADITFKIKNKTYAIEIEKGSLIRKKRQLREKIESLNDDYRNRWLILVSNKGLAKKYREFGKVATRKDLRNKIEKWVKESEIKKNSAKN